MVIHLEKGLEIYTGATTRVRLGKAALILGGTRRLALLPEISMIPFRNMRRDVLHVRFSFSFSPSLFLSISISFSFSPLLRRRQVASLLVPPAGFFRICSWEKCIIICIVLARNLARALSAFPSLLLMKIYGAILFCFSFAVSLRFFSWLDIWVSLLMDRFVLYR